MNAQPHITSFGVTPYPSGTRTLEGQEIPAKDQKESVTRRVVGDKLQTTTPDIATRTPSLSRTVVNQRDNRTPS